MLFDTNPERLNASLSNVRDSFSHQALIVILSLYWVTEFIAQVDSGDISVDLVVLTTLVVCILHKQS